MYLSNLKLWNFRRYGTDGEIDFQNPHIEVHLKNGLNVLVGENDAGKTAIVDAIKVVLKTHSYEYLRIEHNDFFNISERLRIELIFVEFSPDEAKNFIEWLGWTGSGESAEPFLKINLDIKRNGKRILPSDVKGGPDFEGRVLSAEAKEYLKVTYLKPLRDAESELVARKNSRLSQILIGDDAFKGKDKSHELVSIFNKLTIDLKAYFKGELEMVTLDDQGNVIQDDHGQPITRFPEEGKRIKLRIDGYIKSFYGEQYESEFEVLAHDMKSILEKLTLLLKDEFNPGLGTLNRLFIAAELLHLNKPSWSGIRLGLIEEIEAHLHPQAQMQVIQTLQQQSAIQLVLTTHSPNLASKIQLENLVFCNSGNAFSLSSKYTQLDKTDYKFLERFLDVTKANLFFAKGIIMVEGWGEELLLPTLARKIGIDLTERGVSVVNVGNKAFLRYCRIFQRQANPKMTLPVAIITDLDVKPDEEHILTNGESAKERAVRTKTTAFNGDSVRTFVSPHWTLEYCVGISPSLAKALFIATKLAGREMQNSGIYSGKFIAESWRAYSSGKSNQEIGRGIYEDFIGGGKKISKSIIAQYFADIISRSSTIRRQDIEAELTIEYLITAIKYACRI